MEDNFSKVWKYYFFFVIVIVKWSQKKEVDWV